MSDTKGGRPSSLFPFVISRLSDSRASCFLARPFPRFGSIRIRIAATVDGARIRIAGGRSTRLVLVDRGAHARGQRRKTTCWGWAGAPVSLSFSISRSAKRKEDQGHCACGGKMALASAGLSARMKQRLFFCCSQQWHKRNSGRGGGDGTALSAVLA